MCGCVCVCVCVWMGVSARNCVGVHSCTLKTLCFTPAVIEDDRNGSMVVIMVTLIHRKSGEVFIYLRNVLSIEIAIL